MAKFKNFIKNLNITKISFYCGLLIAILFPIFVYSVNSPHFNLFSEKGGFLLIIFIVIIPTLFDLILDFIFIFLKVIAKDSKHVIYLINGILNLIKAILIVLTSFLAIFVLIMIL